MIATIGSVVKVGVRFIHNSEKLMSINNYSL